MTSKLLLLLRYKLIKCCLAVVWTADMPNENPAMTQGTGSAGDTWTFGVSRTPEVLCPRNMIRVPVIRGSLDGGRAPGPRRISMAGADGTRKRAKWLGDFLEVASVATHIAEDAVGIGSVAASVVAEERVSEAASLGREVLRYDFRGQVDVSFGVAKLRGIA